MAKITTLIKISMLGITVMPLVACVCDKTAIQRCSGQLYNALGDVSFQQNFITIIQLYCRPDIQTAILCIIHEGADCYEDTSFLKMVKVEDLQKSCDLISEIPRDALNCLNKAFSFNNTELYQCINLASTNTMKSPSEIGTVRKSHLCSMSRSTQKCQQNAIASICPHYKNVLSSLNQLWNKYLECPDTSSSTAKTSVTAILLTTCFAILRM